MAHGIDEGIAAYDAAQAGDWEGATEHGYMAAADGAYTALTVWGGGAALNRFTRCHSFDPATPVLMAGGTTKAIEDVAIGDLVLATDPMTGLSEAKPVTDLHVNQDWDLTDVTVQNEDTGETSTLHTTWTHPFWNTTDQQWTDAADLQPGVRLREPDGTQDLVVINVNAFVGNARMRDLTVADTHTYYVITGETPILVHNCGETTFHHGTDVESAISLLKGAPLDAKIAAARHTDGPGGFFLATHFDDAEFFATRNGPGAVLDVTISRSGMQALQASGATIRPIPRGRRSPFFAGEEFHIPRGSFDRFNELRSSGDITFRPSRGRFS